MTEVIFGVAAYVVPLAALPFVVKLAPTAKRVAVFALFASPILGAATSLIAERHADAQPGLPLVAQVAARYPFALFPLGFWAAALGAIGTWWLAKLHRRSGAHTLGLGIAGVLGGAVTGACFMAAFTAVGEAVRGANIPPALLASWYVAAGAIAG